MVNSQDECTPNLESAASVMDDDIDILDAALDEVLRSNDPFLFPTDGAAAIPDKEPATSKNLEQAATNDVGVQRNITLANTSTEEASIKSSHSSDPDYDAQVESAGKRPRKPRSSKDAPVTQAQKRAEAREKLRLVGREAQRRFRARQKNVIAELDDQIQSMNLVLEQEKQQNNILNNKNDVMESLLVFKDSQVAALQDAEKQNGPKRIEDRIYPEIALLQLKYAMPGAYNLERLLRFAPAGYTDHLDNDIFAIQAPPLSAQIDQIRSTVSKMQSLLAEATAGINNNSAPSSLDANSTSVSDLANMLINVHLDEAIKKGVAAIPSPPQRSQQPTGVDIIDPQGVRFEYCGIKYLITKDLMERIVDVMLALGYQMWSMGFFFPDSLMEFSTTNLESGQSAATSPEFNDIDRWIHVLRLIGLRQEQLETFARAHYQYLSAVRPMLRERATIMQHLMQAASRQADTIKEHIKATADLGDCTNALREIVRKEYVAWADLLGSICTGCLDYPVQRMLLFTASWPYVPNPNLLGAAAALELGLNPFEYQFNESDFEKAAFLRAKE